MDNIKKSLQNVRKPKINRHTKTPIQLIEIQSDGFHTINIDISGRYLQVYTNDSYNNPHRNLLTCIDRNTKLIEVDRDYS